METKLEIKDFHEELFVNDLLCETWTHDKCDLNVEGYECLIKNRFKKRAARRSSGGTVCYFKKVFGREYMKSSGNEMRMELFSN